MAKFKDALIDQITQTPVDTLHLPEGIDLNFHFYHFMSADENAKQSVNKYSRDAPLHVAIRSESTQLVSLLIAKGASVNIQNGLGDTPLHVAARCGLKDILELLLKEGNVETEIRNLKGLLPMHVAILNGQLACLRLFKRFKAKFDQTNGDSPLRYAIIAENDDIIDYCLRNGAAIQEQPDTWNMARDNFDIGVRIMSFNSKRNEQFKGKFKLVSKI